MRAPEITSLKKKSITGRRKERTGDLKGMVREGVKTPRTSKGTGAHPQDLSPEGTHLQMSKKDPETARLPFSS